MELKESVLELREKINKISNGFDMRYFHNLCYNKLINISKQKGYSSLYSSKALNFLHLRPFLSVLDDGSYVGFMFNFTSDTIKNIKKNGIKINILVFCPIKTKGGTIYFQNNNNKKKLCWTAHSFDRFKERIMGGKGDREDSIRCFFKKMIVSSYACDVKQEQTTGTIRTAFSEGMCVGEIYEDMVLYKTFISTDMFNDKQKRWIEYAEKNELFENCLEGEY